MLRPEPEVKGSPMPTNPDPVAKDLTPRTVSLPPDGIGKNDKKQPLVFLDYSGSCLEWLRQQADNEELGYVYFLRLDPARIEATKTAPVVIMVGVDPALLPTLDDCSVVEVRRKEPK